MHGINETTKAVGKNVIIKNVEDYDSTLRRGKIEIPDNYALNHRVGKAKVVSVGSEVDVNIYPDDVVVYDLHAIYTDQAHARGTTKSNEFLILHIDAILYKENK